MVYHRRFLVREVGQYLDLVLKENKLNNNYTVYNDMGHKLTGDYDAWGTSLSAEYGIKLIVLMAFM